MRWGPGDCRPGDMIRVRLGSVYHYGIFVSEDEVIAFGMPPVAEYADDPERFTVCSTGIDTFSCGRIVEVGECDRSEQKLKKDPDEVIRAARARLGGTGYDLIRNNFEHFANECFFGVKKSLQEEEARKKWADRPVCDVYIAEVTDVPEAPGIACSERENEILGCRNGALKAAKYSDWMLLGHAAERSLALDISSLDFRKTAQGKWTCGSFEFSLSHAGEFVAAAVSNRPVGVDMEIVSEFEEKRGKKAADGIRRRFFTSGEKKLYPDDIEGFLCCWTKKEAEFKRRGKGNFHPLLIDTSRADTVRTVIPELKPRMMLSVSSECVSSFRLFISDYTKSGTAGFAEV